MKGLPLLKLWLCCITIGIENRKKQMIVIYYNFPVDLARARLDSPIFESIKMRVERTINVVFANYPPVHVNIMYTPRLRTATMLLGSHAS